MAILKKYPGTKLGIGPVIENGFYYDVLLPEALGERDLHEFEKTMRELIRQNLAFSGKKITPAEGRALFRGQPFKLELIKDYAKEKRRLTAYRTGDFVDLCKGGHIKKTGEINPDAFALTKVAGAYWKGSEKNQQLTRIYGIAFETPRELADYRAMLEKAERCDHRNLGERLDLYMIDDEIGKGLPLWLPNGFTLRRLLEDYMYNLERARGYRHVLTPNIAKEDLYKKSGHLAHYKEDMYAPIVIENEAYYLKPMNCPHHHAIYKHAKHSYRELPLRIAEFGTVYRYERSGVLSGLIRVRGFTQNDAHIYTSEEHLEREIIAILSLHKEVYDELGITDYWYRLSLPDFKNKEKFGDIKNKAVWERGAGALERALKATGRRFVAAPGEASFYGPKIDIQVKDLYGKEDTIATVQVDYYSAPRFGLSYVAADGTEQPAIVVHRAILGSFDRFVAFLVEKTCGELPLKFAPIQVAVLAVSDKHAVYAASVHAALAAAGIRAELASADETLGKRIRGAEMRKIPYILVVGDKESAAGTVAVRARGAGDIGTMTTDALIQKLAA